MMLSRSISLIYGFLTYFILKADWLHYTLQQKELQWKKGSGNVFGDILRPSLNGCSDFEIEAVGLLILYEAVEVKCSMNCLKRKGLGWWKVVMTGEKLQYQNLIVPWALNLTCVTPIGITYLVKQGE